VDANEGLLASTNIVDADSPSLASTKVDANSPFNFFLKFFDRCISVHKKWTLIVILIFFLIF
jgi:hypothetical protein